MTHYLFALLAVAALCGAWGLFHIWLSKHDPELAGRANTCGNCSCDRRHGDAAECARNRERTAT